MKNNFKLYKNLLFLKNINLNFGFFVLVFSDSSVHALQFLDVINMKDPTQKAHFYRNTLKDSLPYIPRVSGASRTHSARAIKPSIKLPFSVSVFQCVFHDSRLRRAATWVPAIK